MRSLLLLVALASCVGAQRPVTESKWLRARAGAIEVLSDAGERSVRQALERLDTLRQVIPAGDARGPLELEVYLMTSKSDFLAYAPNPASQGFYQSGLERDFIVAHAATGLDRVVVHEYVHYLMSQHGSSLPLWLQEGLAEFYSNLAVTSNDKSRARLRVGSPIESHRELMRRETWLDAADLRFPPPALEQGDARLGAVYYAQSWALVHMLNLDSSYRDGMQRYVQMLANGSSANDALVFEQAFSRTFERALTDLRAYMPRIAAANIDAPPLDPLPAIRTESITAADALLRHASLAMHTGNQPLAAQLYQQAAKDYPDTAAVALGLGTLASAQGRAEEARSHLDRATRLDPRNGSAWFEFAMLEQDSGGSSSRVRGLLEQAVAANPNLGEARVLLGVRASDEGKYSAAVEHLEQAAGLLPRRSHVWLALAFAQDKLGLPAAEKSAIRAVRTAVTLEQAAAAEALLRGMGTGQR